MLNPIRAVITATIVVLIALAFAPPSPDGGVSSSRHHHPTPPNHLPYNLDGVGLAVAQTGAWYKAATPPPAPPKPPRPVSHNSPAVRTAQPGTAQFDDAAFDRVARCETGGNWSHQTAFDGGLGILHANWLHWGGTEFAPYGSQASREQQIIVARRLIADVGYHGWGCWHAFFE